MSSPAAPPADPNYREYIIVTGGRDFRDGRELYAALDALLAFSKPEWLVIVHGRCKTGADAIADTWARSREIDCESYPAQWTRQGKRAGPLRNQRMLATILARNMPVMILHCPGGDGTTDMMWRVEAARKDRDIKVSPLYSPMGQWA
jgi:hypothetical protein